MLTRDKQILAGLFLSKYDSVGLKQLGFESFVEAFNVLGYSLGARPASIKNYRDEFDPMFPNARKGWHRRPTREYCLAVYEKYKGLDLISFGGLIKSFLVSEETNQSEAGLVEQQDDGLSSFAQRLITGLAAEQYFESVQSMVPEFKDCNVENTTQLGCGYDYRLRREPDHAEFLAIEVKGLKGQTGSLLMTPKEHAVALELRERFFLFLVKNFRESPRHEIYPDPLFGSLQFERSERVIIQVAWLAAV